MTETHPTGTGGGTGPADAVATPTADGLARLVDRPAVFRERPEPAPLVHHGDPGWAAELLSVENVRALVRGEGPAPASATMAKDNAFIDPGLFARADGTPDPAGVEDRLAAGGSLVLRGLHRTWPPVVELCRRVSAELGRGAQANSYLTPPGAQGFGHHWDVHSVFMVQTHGEKTWELYLPLVEAPDRPHSFTPEELAALRAEGRVPARAETPLVLRAGDVLWLPRGWIHNGFTTDSWSLHVSLGIGAATEAARPAVD